MNEGIKIGQKVKGFRFDDSSGVHYHEEMEKMVGKTGTITAIYEDHFAITFGGDIYTSISNSWGYPIGKYLEMRREERLKELGILDEVEIPRSGILCDTEISQSEILDEVEIPQKSGIL